MSWSGSRVVIVSGILACFGVGIGVIIGHFGISSSQPSPGASDSTAPTEVWML